ncbi:MAG: hypothetical protein DCF15_17890 [Phormidesmis priestleyi]|uniref:Uncharacterized protein n=1 Tax=Phormidesmis priestleyi TaxID=268141 RepID=A0A2W4WZA3_9CYAN|nr:MAG: hypothetical protein DCF15_17890 [Phormidesmis priestleyi]
MRQQLEKRLQELKAELVSGQRAMAEIETQQANLQATLLRISGAIQVLKEVLEEPLDETPSDTPDESVNGATTAEALSTKLTS